MSFHCTSNIKYNFGFYVAHGWSISNLCSVVSNTCPSLQPNSFPTDLQGPHCSHLHTFHFSPLLPDLITSFTGWNSISNVLLSKIQSNCLVSSISPTYNLNSYFPRVQVFKKLQIIHGFPSMPYHLHTYVTAHTFLSEKSPCSVSSTWIIF